MPGLSRSRLGAWICTDPAVAERILGDERFGVRRADGGKPHLQVLPLDETFLGAEPSAQRRIAELLGPELGAVRADTVRRHADALLAGCGDEFELVGDVAEPLAVRVLAELFGLDGIAGELPALATALDALRTPPALADALALARASRALRDTLAATADGDLLAGRVLATVLVLATVPTLLGNAVRSPAHAGDPASVVDGALHAHPPVRLLCRVAHTAADIAGTTVAAGRRSSSRSLRAGAPSGCCGPNRAGAWWSRSSGCSRPRDSRPCAPGIPRRGRSRRAGIRGRR
ncbi:hypothetical protein ACFSVJ_04030 [Prauserella oleivorans]